MPLVEFVCNDCQIRVEVLRKTKDLEHPPERIELDAQATRLRGGCQHAGGWKRVPSVPQKHAYASVTFGRKGNWAWFLLASSAALWRLLK